MPRKKLIAANWKMNKTVEESEAFAKRLKSALAGLPDCDLAVFPSFLSVPATAAVLADTAVHVGAQDVFWEPSGAFTGEVSVAMIRDVGGTHVLIGHSERRHVIGESNEVVAKKLKAAVEGGLVPVLCVGEKIEDRDAGAHETRVREQLDSALAGWSAAGVKPVIVAYEPVWAIGTGKTATAEDAEAMHRFIRRSVAERFDDSVADRMRILYGGSVKPDNARTLLEPDDIDGALIGGASLQLESYLRIAAEAGQG